MKIARICIIVWDAYLCARTAKFTQLPPPKKKTKSVCAYRPPLNIARYIRHCQRQFEAHSKFFSRIVNKYLQKVKYVSLKWFAPEIHWKNVGQIYCDAVRVALGDRFSGWVRSSDSSKWSFLKMCLSVIPQMSIRLTKPKTKDPRVSWTGDLIVNAALEESVERQAIEDWWVPLVHPVHQVHQDHPDLSPLPSHSNRSSDKCRLDILFSTMKPLWRFLNKWEDSGIFLFCKLNFSDYLNFSSNYKVNFVFQNYDRKAIELNDQER